MKNCSKCREVKTMDQFAVYKGKPHCQCKSCQRSSNNAYRIKNPERARRMVANATLRRKYGITIEQYERMFVRQNGVCAICSRMSLNGRTLDVDHNHNTGQVRGLLCPKCNMAMGLLGENIDIFKKTIAYLEKHETLASIGVA